MNVNKLPDNAIIQIVLNDVFFFLAKYIHYTFIIARQYREIQFSGAIKKRFDVAMPLHLTKIFMHQTDFMQFAIERISKRKSFSVER